MSPLQHRPSAACSPIASALDKAGCRSGRIGSTGLPGLALLACAAAGSAALSSLAAGLLSPALANSSLLESVKQNPQKARALCAELRELNAQGISYTSPQAISRIAARQDLSPTDAEILSTYVVGLYCPEVR